MTGTVSVTIDGKKVNVIPGPISFQDLVSHTVSQASGSPKITKFTVTSPTPASTINGNDSFVIQGGEVITSVHP
jgi:hypothetical protein